MSEEKRPIINVDLHPLVMFVTFVVMSIGTGVFFLVRGIQAGDNTAYLILGALVALGLSGIGGAWVLAVLGLGHRWADQRNRQEQERFGENARENLAIMGAVQKVQSGQNAMLLKQAREAQRMLPSGGSDVIDVDALIIEDEMFADLED